MPDICPMLHLVKKGSSRYLISILRNLATANETNLSIKDVKLLPDFLRASSTGLSKLFSRSFPKDSSVSHPEIPPRHQSTLVDLLWT